MSDVKLVLGTMTFGESVFNPMVEEFINTFLNAGYDELDTAYVYNDGDCERLLGKALKNIDKPYKIATKINPRISGKLDGAAAYKQLNESLQRLELESVDTVFTFNNHNRLTCCCCHYLTKCFCITHLVWIAEFNCSF